MGKEAWILTLRQIFPARDEVRQQSRLLKERALELASLCHDIVAQLDSAISDLSKYIDTNPSSESPNCSAQELVAENGSAPSFNSSRDSDSNSRSVTKDNLADNDSRSASD